jgi:nicotinamidase/pyrazinamidase
MSAYREKIKLPFEYTASIDVDCQKGFTPLCPDELPVISGHLIVPELNEQAKFAKLRICTKDWHSSKAVWIASEEHPQLSYISAFYIASHPNVDVYWKAHCMAGTEGAELLEGLPRECDYNFIVYKGLEKDMHPYGAAYHDLEEKLSTGLVEFLRCNQITNVILGGLALDYCVSKTAKQLYKNGFRVFVNISACKALGNTRDAMNDLRHHGIQVIETLGEICKG